MLRFRQLVVCFAISKSLYKNFHHFSEVFWLQTAKDSFQDFLTLTIGQDHPLFTINRK